MALKKQLQQFFWSVLTVMVAVAVVACAQNPPTSSTTRTAPKLVLSGTRIPAKGYVQVRGSGFSPKADVISHLKKPDGTEYPEVAMLTDAKGELTHEIDTLLLYVGTHELWMVETKTGVSSNVAKFEVTLDQPPKK